MAQTHPIANPPAPRALMRSSFIVYSAMFLVGFEICWWFHKNIDDLFRIVGVDWFLALRISVVAVTFLTLGQHCLEEFFPSYRRLKATFAQLFRGLSSGQIFMLAVLSSVGEEMLFRGAMQPYLGVWLTSFVFALLHLDPLGRLSIWTLWAFIGGLVMGYAVETTGSLWPAVMIHFAVNAISISRISRLPNPESANDSKTLSPGRKP